MRQEPERVSDWVEAPLPFGATFVKSEAFKELFRDGMGLVEQTAAYLDGPGRAESGLLVRNAALAYASESMRLTTRLMQIASWLLVQRAVAEGEITTAQAEREKERVRLATPGTSPAEAVVEVLPEAFQDLVAHSLRLHARILHLDALIAGSATGPALLKPSPVAMQQGLLRKIFEIG